MVTRICHNIVPCQEHKICIQLIRLSHNSVNERRIQRMCVQVCDVYDSKPFQALIQPIDRNLKVLHSQAVCASPANDATPLQQPGHHQFHMLATCRKGEHNG